MDISLSKLLRPQLFVFKKAGLWSSAKSSDFFHFLFGFLIPVSGYIFIQLMSLLYVDSVQQKVANLVQSGALVVYSVKGLVFYYVRSELIKIPDLMSVLEEKIDKENRSKIIKRAYKLGCILFLSFTISYVSCWVSWVLQGIFAATDSPKWSSSQMYPPMISQNKNVFSFVLLFQALLTLSSRCCFRIYFRCIWHHR